MHSQSAFFGEILAYLLIGRLLVRHGRGGFREVAFGLLNLAAFRLFFFAEEDSRYLPTFLAYVGLVVLFYISLRLFAHRKGWLPWLAFFTPLFFLALIRYVPPSVYGGPHYPYGPFFIGLSYLAFRNSYLVVEIRNGAVAAPGFWRYVGYSFFAPTVSVGPISPYQQYQRGFAAEVTGPPPGRSALRLLVGLVKYKFLGSVLFQLTYANFLLDDHYHPWMDLPVAMVSYYLFLYFNFSGFCDMAIGAAGLMGIPVAENFNNPLLARNMREFWNRWHITLSQWMRDIVYAPLSKYLVGWFGPSRANHAIAVTIALVFLLIGVWHGVGWNYAAFGLAQSLGVVAVHYYTIFLKKRLGRDGFKAYNENRWIHAVAVVMTFCYYAATLFLFANTLPQMTEIFRILR